MSYFLGIDGGGSKTVCLIETGDGRILGRGLSGPANYLKVGVLTARLSIRDAVRDALSQSGVSKSEIQSSCAGIAGV